MTNRYAAILALGVCAAAACVVAGCEGGRNLTLIASQEQFDKQVLGADRPVLVDFYKDNCPTCVIQESVLDELAEEYRGRVIFAKFKVMSRFFGVTSPEIRDRYRLYWVPTVILFVNGQEQKRWVFNHAKRDFYDALNAVAPPIAASQPDSSGAGSP